MRLRVVKAVDAIHRVVRNEQQREGLIIDQRALPLPFQVKISKPLSPKTLKQISYAHSLCGALAAYMQCSPEAAKRDAKAEYGVVIVCMSVVTGDRTARLKSFADYSKEEMVAFISAMEAHLSEHGIPFHASEQQYQEAS